MRLIIKAITTVALMSVSILSVAQQGETEARSAKNTSANSAIEEVTVTARRREESIQTVPIPVSALSGEDLANRGVDDLEDLSRIVPNLSFVSSITNGNSSQVFLRGIGQVNWQPVQDPKVGIYLNGVYLARSQGSIFDIVDVERVEVVRGPQGTLFGRNTTAGLVHVITKKPTDEFASELKIGAGNDSAFTVSGILNVPISDKFLTRFTIQHAKSDGYVENQSTNEDWNDENAQAFRAAALWLPSEKVEAILEFDYQRAREYSALAECTWTGPDASPALLATQGLPPLAYIFNVYDEIKDACNNTSRYRSNENDPGEDTLDSWGVSFTVDADINNSVTLTSIASARSVTNFSNSWGQATDAKGTPSYLEILGVEDNEYEQWSYEIRVAGGAGNALQWVGGVYAFQEEGVNSLDVPVFRGVAAPTCVTWPIWCVPAPAALGLPAGTTLGQFALGTQAALDRRQYVKAENSSFAVFGEVDWSFTDSLTLTAGLRYTQDERKFTRTQQLNSPLAPGGLVNDPMLTCPGGVAPTNGIACSDEVDFDEVLGRLILSYQAQDNILLYGGWSKGYSSGGFNQDVRMRPFDPEISGNFEAGMKSTWLEGKLRFNLTGFYNIYENQQITVSRLVNNQPTADLINAQEARLWGLEGELNWLIGNGFFVNASFGLTNGEYEEFTVQDNTGVPVAGGGLGTIMVERDLKDSEAIQGSPYTLSATAGYSWENAEHAFIGQVGYSHRGRMFSTLEGLNSSRQDAFGLMDARLTWSFTRGNNDSVVSVSVWGTNLLDEEYFTGALDFSGGTTPSHYVSKYWDEPRRFGAEVTYSYK